MVAQLHFASERWPRVNEWWGRVLWTVCKGRLRMRYAWYFGSWYVIYIPIILFARDLHFPSMFTNPDEL